MTVEEVIKKVKEHNYYSLADAISSIFGTNPTNIVTKNINEVHSDYGFSWATDVFVVEGNRYVGLTGLTKIDNPKGSATDYGCIVIAQEYIPHIEVVYTVKPLI